jgi:hypothetical protein
VATLNVRVPPPSSAWAGRDVEAYTPLTTCPKQTAGECILSGGLKLTADGQKLFYRVFATSSTVNLQPIIAAIYLPTRRLAPLIVGHWIIDYCPRCSRAARKGALET